MGYEDGRGHAPHADGGPAGWKPSLHRRERRRGDRRSYSDVAGGGAAAAPRRSFGSIFAADILSTWPFSAPSCGERSEAREARRAHQGRLDGRRQDEWDRECGYRRGGWRDRTGCCGAPAVMKRGVVGDGSRIGSDYGGFGGEGRGEETGGVGWNEDEGDVVH